MKCYLRYGDDTLVMAPSLEEITYLRTSIVAFLSSHLRLEINPRHDRIIQAWEGVRFLGAYVYPNHRQLNRRNWRRSQNRLSLLNYSSYRGLVQVYERVQRRREYAWHTYGAIKSIPPYL